MKLFGIIWTIFSMPFAIFGLAETIMQTDFSLNSVQTTARVVATTSSCPTVTYQPLTGPAFTAKVSQCPEDSSYSAGEQIKISYNRNNYREVHEGSAGIGPVIMSLVFFGMGMLFVIIGINMVTKAISEEKRLAWLKAHGQRVYAELSEIGEESDYGTWYRPFFIWTDPNNFQTYTFAGERYKSRDKIPYGNRVEVLIDPSNPKSYLIDIVTMHYADQVRPNNYSWPSV